MTKQRIYLVLAGSEPDAITEQVGIQPTRTINREGKTGRRREWILDSDVEPSSRSAKAQFMSILDKLAPRWAHFLLVARQCDVYLNWVVELDLEDGSPDMNVDGSVLRKLAEIGASLDIDLV
ncbi:MAG: DUF4279 domain-containing protein [Vulcanimicrobiaceae bacterium]